MEICEYGCGKRANYQLKNKKWCCEDSSNKCSCLREKNSKGCKKAYKTGEKKSYFTDVDREKSRVTFVQNLKSKPFEEWGPRLIRAQILSEQENKCLGCGLEKWLDKQITLEIDHIDGDHKNNKRENLRALCPNCHSQTDTFRGKNINSGRKKVEDKIIIELLKEGLSIRQVLLKCNLAAKGGNYKRVKEIYTGMS